jgi:hypothetical protein
VCDASGRVKEVDSSDETSVVEKSDAKGKEALAIGGFYSRRRERGLVVGPHIGLDGGCGGSLAAATVSGWARASPILGWLTSGAAVG